ncbi:4014_t:CDS:2 [Diversispora eburnea]|uniref:4014_t:CDS:1 n=1 Tax=Diversispora eburnea TaxID=1213867 RepID=A0A9N9C390_9GLOM|nr:4014_t:CDS:2 [Diversispora eburnea]
MGNIPSRMESAYVARKDLEASIMKRECEAREREFAFCGEKLKNKSDLERKKANIEHQHKINELIAQRKQTKLHAGKEILLSYLNMMTSIIEQNNTACHTAISLSQLNSDKLSDSMNELLDYSKKQVQELKLQQDDEFGRLLDFAVDRGVITTENKLYLIE